MMPHTDLDEFNIDFGADGTADRLVVSGTGAGDAIAATGSGGAASVSGLLSGLAVAVRGAQGAQGTVEHSDRSATKTVGAHRRRRRACWAWVITLAAMAASTFALGAVATSTGVLLVASQLLSGLGHLVVLAFLAITYVLWGVMMRANLGANWLLLERTGTSTNALSKAAFELARRRGPRAQRVAAATGYVATELAKEVPYYAGAFGAAVLTDSVSSSDALVFLAGTNLGAAGYEYVLARLTRRLLRRPRCASFDTDWVPREYLADYYRVVEPDEREPIAFFAEAISEAPDGEAVLVFGTGPTLHHVFLVAPKVSEIHLADYLPANLDEIKRWRSRDPAAHDWRSFVRYTLECEGVTAPTDAEITQREELTRSKVTRLLQVDARGPVPLDRRYATVISAYCADSATDDRATWETLMANITDVVAPGGLFITAALRRCRSYLVGDKRFPSANIDEHDLRRVLAPDFNPRVQVRKLQGHEAQGYSSVVLARARRRTAPVRPRQPEDPVRGLRSEIGIARSRSR